MPDYLPQFQAYLERTQKSNFGKMYAVGVLLTNKPNLGGGYAQGPPCSTSGRIPLKSPTKPSISLVDLGALILRYRPVPWIITALCTYEIADTLAVVHQDDLSDICKWYPTVEFCASPNLPAECTCMSKDFPAEQCLMTFLFGRARTVAPRYTPCDIELMNHFSSNIACLAPVSPTDCRCHRSMIRFLVTQRINGDGQTNLYSLFFSNKFACLETFVGRSCCDANMWRKQKTSYALITSTQIIR